MADSRAKDLVKRAFSSLADLTGVRLWSDKEGETDAKGLEISEILSSDTVENSSVDYKCLTPKGFWDTYATNTRRGVVTTASNTDIIDKNAASVILANQQTVMQNQWKEDLFTSNGGFPNTAYKGIRSGSTYNCMTYHFNDSYNSMSLYQKFDLSPDFSCKIRAVYLTLLMYDSQSSMPFQARGSYYLGATGETGVVETNINSDFTFFISSDRTQLYIQAGVAKNIVAVSGTIHMIYYDA